MSIISLFDKSFVQSLTVDESVWFDRFFYPVVCPIFYVETLADLSKTPRGDRTADDEVRIIADKFPQMSGTPCADHFNMAVHDILGVFQPPMDGRIPPWERVVRPCASIGRDADAITTKLAEPQVVRPCAATGRSGAKYNRNHWMYHYHNLVVSQ